MSNHKYLISMLLMFACCLTATADHFTIGPEAGYEHAAYHACEKGVDASGANGFRVGVNATYNLSNGMFIQSGLYYSMINGGNLNNIAGKSHFPPFVSNVEIRRAEYLTFPLSIGYEISLPHNFAVGINAGGYIAGGIGDGSTYFRLTDNEGNGGALFGKTEFTHYVEESNSREPVTINKSGRVDAGILLGANVRFKDLELKVFYQLGLNKTIYDIAIPRTCGLALAYNFRLK